MKENLKNIPLALQKQILIRFGYAAAVFLFFVYITIYIRDLRMSVPSLVLTVFMVINGIVLLNKAVSSTFISLEGLCGEIEISGRRKRKKFIYVISDDKILKIPYCHKMRRIGVGDTVSIYLSDKEKVYPQDGAFIIYSYYAIEIRKNIS